MATIADVLAESSVLREVSDTPRLDVEVLLCHVLNTHRGYLYTWPEQDISEMCQQRFDALLLRRKRGEPVAHLIGKREFWSLEIKVNPATLVPRPETELLVEATLQTVTSVNARILDLGTGTGAIALALASERPDWSVTAVDCIPEAVSLAKENVVSNGVTNVTVLESDWFTEIRRQQFEPFDAIVGNPPYIAADDPHLQQGDVRYEPVTALVSDKGGVADLELIIQQSVDFLAMDGWILLEHGYQQGHILRELLSDTGYTSIKTIKDLAGRERVTLARRQR